MVVGVPQLDPEEFEFLEATELESECIGGTASWSF